MKMSNLSAWDYPEGVFRVEIKKWDPKTKTWDATKVTQITLLMYEAIAKNPKHLAGILAKDFALLEKIMPTETSAV